MLFVNWIKLIANIRFGKQLFECEHVWLCEIFARIQLFQPLTVNGFISCGLLKSKNFEKKLIST